MYVQCAYSLLLLSSLLLSLSLLPGQITGSGGQGGLAKAELVLAVFVWQFRYLGKRVLYIQCSNMVQCCGTVHAAIVCTAARELQDRYTVCIYR